MPQQQWREIQRTPSPPAQATSEARNAPLRPPLERNLAISDFPHNTNVPSTEVVMNELQDLTYQYVNVADPTDAAARRQRVIQSESEGLMETTAARIIANATNNNLQDGRRQIEFCLPRPLREDSGTERVPPEELLALPAFSLALI
ncbi:hypothetical protein F2Q68_00009038 [Brassica cretica]|uniref:Uncharacterized protein n=1 Tax=Brassica cretica TaxID=69181 RepID=A0A8S9KY98_BRACR|nr:hypothetical protein F2Q68_00009038 [Brassica cretica]